jgi:hypothetical protein
MRPPILSTRRLAAGLILAALCSCERAPTEPSARGLASGPLRSGEASPFDIPPPDGVASALVATPVSSTRIDLTWIDGAQTETSFALERRTLKWNGTWTNWLTLAPAAANTTSRADSGLSAGTTYTYRIRACADGGCSPSSASANVSTFGPTAAPPAPANLATTYRAPTRVVLAWPDVGPLEIRFELRRKQRALAGSFGPFHALQTLAQNTVTYTDSVTPGNEYVYLIRACNAVQCSDSTTSGAVTIPVIPAAPTSLTAHPAAPMRIDLAWTDNAENEQTYEVQRRTRNGDGSWASFGLLTIRPPNATALQDATAAVNVTYSYIVRACNVTGCSAWAASGAATVPPVPTAPTGVTTSSVSSIKLTVKWTGNSASVSDFRIFRQRYGSVVTTDSVGKVAATVTAYGATGLTASTTYVFRVKACNSINQCSDFTDSAPVTTP